ncbi:hypothetical protein [Nonomuraea jiangxiensis]|uniref:hypothetical protein n=1 Tax=Nonomuraea jiangxiensis TaxID=633440 RepID=UPI00115F89B2|nr:hypothetical protein [Nonomuraea jiangxiensis]
MSTSPVVSGVGRVVTLANLRVGVVADWAAGRQRSYRAGARHTTRSGSTGQIMRLLVRAGGPRPSR